jgi:hypothetical protein
MAGIAEQRHAALAPSRQRAALVDAPLVHLGARRSTGLNIGMKVQKGCAQLREIALLVDQDSRVIHSAFSGWLVVK